MADYTKINLREIEDMAAKYGHAGNHEARFPTKPLGLEKSGLSLQKILPGKRMPFGHHHDHQEELYIILSGQGQMKLDDDIVEVGPMDAIRVPAAVVRSVAASDTEPLELLVIGAPQDDADRGTMIKDWWPA